MPSHIDVFGDDPASAAELCRALENAGFAVGSHGLAEVESRNGDAAGLALIDGAGQPDNALRACHALRTRTGDNYVPILFVSADASPTSRLASLECGADTYLLRPYDPAELLAQVQALLRIKERHDELTARTQEVHRINKRLQTAYQQIDMELELAKRIQESFLPQSLPRLPGVRFAAKYRPCGRVGGDFYDVFRLDEHHVGFYIADAMGHGVPASLLTVFVKTSVKAKEISGQSYRLVPPDEILTRLNRELIAQKLQDCPFITLVSGLYNAQTCTLQLSRAGHPYPLHSPKQGEPRLIQMEGSLLGVFDTTYRLQTCTLTPGDKLILYTDGMDAAAFQSFPVGSASLLAAVQHYRDLPIEEIVDRLSGDLFGQTSKSDDLTILGMEVMEP